MLKGKISAKIRSGLTMAVTLSALSLPFVAANAASSSYSFSMLAVADGCANGQMHPLSAGSARIQGSTYTPSSSGIHVQYNLQREVFGPNPSFGTVDGGVNQSFVLQFPTSISQTGTNYCLYVYRGSSDGITVSGSGTLYNP